MNDKEMPGRVYNLRFLNTDLQKEQFDNLLVKDVRIGPSGTIECTRIFNDSDSEYKVFYNGEYLIEEIDQEQLEEMKRADEEHRRRHHGDEDE